MATTVSQAPTAAQAGSTSEAGKLANAFTLALLVFLCVTSCGLMLMLDPRSLDVGSVYQGF